MVEKYRNEPLSRSWTPAVFKAAGTRPEDEEELIKVVRKGEMWVEIVWRKEQGVGHTDYLSSSVSQRGDLVSVELCLACSTPNRTNTVGPGDPLSVNVRGRREAEEARCT